MLAQANSYSLVPTHSSTALTSTPNTQGFSRSSSSSAANAPTRFSIELPLPGDSPAESAALLADVLGQLPPAATADAVVVCASEATAAAVKGAAKGRRVLSLQAACRDAAVLSGPLVLVEPTTADVSGSVCGKLCWRSWM